MSVLDRLAKDATVLFWAHSPEKAPGNILTAYTAACEACDRAHMNLNTALEVFRELMRSSVPLPVQRDEVEWAGRVETVVQLIDALLAQKLLQDRALQAEDKRRVNFL